MYNIKIGDAATIEQFRACVHCQHFRDADKGQPLCGRAEALNGTWDVVRGERRRKGAYEMRQPRGPCGQEGRLWEAPPLPRRPIRDGAVAIGNAAGAFWDGLARGPVAVGEWRRAKMQAWRHRLAAKLVAPEQPKPLDVHASEVVEQVTDANVVALRAAGTEMREGVTVEPVKEVEPAPADPAPLPQTEGKFPLEHNPKEEAKFGVAVTLACIMLLLGMMAASMIGERRAVSATDRTFGSLGHWCYPAGSAARYSCQVARRGSGTCCYRWHDGSTRCYDCSTTT